MKTKLGWKLKPPHKQKSLGVDLVPYKHKCGGGKEHGTMPELTVLLEMFGE